MTFFLEQFDGGAESVLVFGTIRDFKFIQNVKIRISEILLFFV